MNSATCPVCNYLISDYDTQCPSCGSTVTPKKDIEKQVKTVFTTKELKAFAKSNKSNKEILSSLTEEQRQIVATYKDMKNEYPWEAIRESQEVIPEAKIVMPKQKKTPVSPLPKNYNSAASNKQTKQTTAQAVKLPRIKKEKISIILNILSFIFPGIGILYFLSAKSSKQRKAKWALGSACLGFVVTVVYACLVEFNVLPEDMYATVYEYVVLPIAEFFRKIQA